MNGQKAKLLRKIARLTGRSDTYIKKEYKKMDPLMQKGYVSYMQENLRRFEEMRHNPPVDNPDSIILDQRLGKEA